MALAGTFGYELDVTKIPKEDREQIPQQIAMYHKYHELVREGDYYRIASYSENHLYDCWAVSAKDKSEVLVTYVQVLSTPNAHSRKLYLKGFEPQAVYQSRRDRRNLYRRNSGKIRLSDSSIMGRFSQQTAALYKDLNVKQKLKILRMRTMILKVSSGKCDTCLFITGVVNSRCEIPIGGDRYLVRVERCVRIWRENH